MCVCVRMCLGQEVFNITLLGILTNIYFCFGAPRMGFTTEEKEHVRNNTSDRAVIFRLRWQENITFYYSKQLLMTMYKCQNHTTVNVTAFICHSNKAAATG